MALQDVDTITELTNYFGAVELDINNMIDESYTGSIMENMVLARKMVYDEGMSLNSYEFDRTRQLAESMRINESTITNLLQNSLSLSIGALDNYFRLTFATGMREYYDGSDASKTVAWNNMFRQLWRREKNQELVIRLATAVKGAGTWTTSVVTPGIELPSELEVRTDTTIGASNISLAIGLTSEDGDEVNSGMSIISNTTEATTTQITYNDTSVFIDLRTLTVSGGTNGDELSIWVTV